MSPHHRAMLSYLRSIGARNIRVEPGGKHNRLVFEYRGVEHFHIIAGSPGDSVYSAKRAVADLKRMLGLRAQRCIGKHRRRRARMRQAPPAECPALTALPDWRERLAELVAAAG